jgi:hypothetical protein
MTSPPQDLFRLLVRALGLSLVGAIIILAGIWVISQYGIGVFLFAWAALFLVALGAGPQLEIPAWVREALSTTNTTRLPSLPQGQLFPDADSMRVARREIGRVIDVEGRRDAELQHMLNGDDEETSKAAIAAMKAEGTWPYYSLSLLHIGLGAETRPRRINSLLLEAGAYFPRHDDSYNPAVFSGARFFENEILDIPLIERMISLGCDINDRDIAQRNLLEKTIEQFVDRSKVYGAMMSQQAASPYLDAMTQLLDLKSEISSRHAALLEKYTTRLAVGSEPKIRTLLHRIRADHAAELLDDKTQAAAASPRVARL